MSAEEPTVFCGNTNSEVVADVVEEGLLRCTACGEHVTEDMVPVPATEVSHVVE